MSDSDRARHARATALFERVCELAEPERARVLEAECAGDAGLHDAVVKLLAHDASAGDFLEQLPQPTRSHSPPGPEPGQPTADEPPLETIGSYRVLDVLGRGGMGVVYRARQSRPEREVALKLIRPELLSSAARARLEREAELLGRLQHPGIARVYEAGQARIRGPGEREFDQPYIAMELVVGRPIAAHVHARQLPTDAIVRLLLRVCEAVQHAHQRGVLHLDLKPANILVDAADRPCVLDFGVSQALNAPLPAPRGSGSIAGTLAYMPPEQLLGRMHEFDTRTDIFALGALAFELLSGRPRYDFRGLSYDDVLLKLVSGVEPSLTAAAPRLGAELVAVIERASARAKERRYASVSEFAADMQRYLDGEPVHALPRSPLRVARLYLRRRAAAATLAAVACAAAAIGVAGLALGLINARNAHALAQKRAENAQAAAEYLEGILFQVDPEFGGGRMSLQEVIEAASASIEDELGAYPEVEASVRESIGVAFRRRSEFAKAWPHLRESLDIRQGLFGDTSLETAASFIAMADLQFEHEGSIDDALAMLGRAHRSYELHGLTGKSAEAWLQLDIGLVSLAGDRLANAEDAFTVCRRLLAEHLGPEHPDVSRAVSGLAMVALAQGDLVEAERRAQLAVTLSDGEGTEYIGAQSRLALAQVLLESNRIGEAAEQLEIVRTQLARTVGERHIRIAEHDACLTELFLRQGDFALAENAAARCDAMRRELLEEHHWAILEARLLRQRAQIGLGDAETAEIELLAISEEAERRLGPDHPLVLRVASARVDCSRALGDEELAAVRAARLAYARDRRAERLQRDRLPIRMTAPSDAAGPG